MHAHRTRPQVLLYRTDAEFEPVSLAARDEGGVASLAVQPLWDEAAHLVTWSLRGGEGLQAAVVPNYPGAGPSARIRLRTDEVATRRAQATYVAAGPRGAVFACTDEVVARYDVCRAAAPEAEGETPWTAQAAGVDLGDAVGHATATWQASWDASEYREGWAGWARWAAGREEAQAQAHAHAQAQAQARAQEAAANVDLAEEGGEEEGEEAEEEGGEEAAAAAAALGALHIDRHNSDDPFPLRRLLSYGPSWGLLAAAMGRHGDTVALWDVRARGDRGAVGAVRAPGAVGWLHLDESQALAGHLLLSTAGGTQVAVYDVRRLAPAGSAPRPVARLAVPAGAAVACFAAEGDAAVVGGGPRSSVAWAYSGLRSEAFFEAAAAPRATAAAKATKPKRQSRQHEKATKSKVKYGSRR